MLCAQSEHFNALCGANSKLKVRYMVIGVLANVLIGVPDMLELSATLIKRGIWAIIAVPRTRIITRHG